MSDQAKQIKQFQEYHQDKYDLKLKSGVTRYTDFQRNHVPYYQESWIRVLTSAEGGVSHGDLGGAWRRSDAGDVKKWRRLNPINESLGEGRVRSGGWCTFHDNIWVLVRNIRELSLRQFKLLFQHLHTIHQFLIQLNEVLNYSALRREKGFVRQR